MFQLSSCRVSPQLPQQPRRRTFAADDENGPARSRERATSLGPSKQVRFQSSIDEFLIADTGDPRDHRYKRNPNARRIDDDGGKFGSRRRTIYERQTNQSRIPDIRAPRLIAPSTILEKRKVLHATRRSQQAQPLKPRLIAAYDRWAMANAAWDAYQDVDPQLLAIQSAASCGARWFLAQTFHGWAVAVITEPDYWRRRFPALPHPLAVCFERGERDPDPSRPTNLDELRLSAFIHVYGVTADRCGLNENDGPRTLSTPLVTIEEQLVFTHVATRWSLDRSTPPLCLLRREPAMYTDAQVRSTKPTHDSDEWANGLRRVSKLGHGETKAVTVATAWIWGPAEVSRAFIDSSIGTFNENYWYEVEVFRPQPENVPLVYDSRVVGILPSEYANPTERQLLDDYYESKDEDRDKRNDAQLVRLEPFGNSSNRSTTGGLFPVRLFELSPEQQDVIRRCAQPTYSWTQDQMVQVNARILRLTRIVTLRVTSYTRTSGKHRFEDLAVELAHFEDDNLTLRMTPYDFYSSWNTLKDGCRVLLHSTEYPRHIDLFIVTTAHNGTLTLQPYRQPLTNGNRRAIYQLMPFGDLTSPEQWTKRSVDWLWNFRGLKINPANPLLCISCAEENDMDGLPFMSVADETIHLLYRAPVFCFWRMIAEQTRIFRIVCSMPIDDKDDEENLQDHGLCPDFQLELDDFEQKPNGRALTAGSWQELPDEFNGRAKSEDDHAEQMDVPNNFDWINDFDVNSLNKRARTEIPIAINPFASNPMHGREDESQSSNSSIRNSNKPDAERSRLFRAVMRRDDHVVVQVGGAGTGKTRSLGRLTRELYQWRQTASGDVQTRGGREFLIVLSAQTNDAVDQLAVELIKARVPPHCILHCTSQRARELRYTNHSGEHLPSDFVDAFSRLSHQCLDLNALATAELRKIKRIVALHRADSRFAHEFGKSVLHAFQSMSSTCRVIVGTVGVVRRLLLQLDQPVDLLAIDEGNLLTTIDAIAMLASARNSIRRLLVTGDLHYVETFVPISSPILADYGLQSFLRTCYQHPGSSIIQKTTSHRFHPQYFDALNHSIYDRNLRLSPDLDTRYLRAFDKLPSRCPRAPVILVHEGSKEQKDENDTSTYNPRQAVRVCNVIELLIKRLPDLAQGLLTCAVLTFYSRMQKELADLLTPMLLQKHGRIFDQFEVSTVDTFGGREVDIVVLAMVRQKPSNFVFNTHRLASALTRARQGLIIVGEMGSREAWRDQRLGRVVSTSELSADVADGLNLMRSFLDAAGDEADLEDVNWKFSS